MLEGPPENLKLVPMSPFQWTEEKKFIEKEFKIKPQRFRVRVSNIPSLNNLILYYIFILLSTIINISSFINCQKLLIFIRIFFETKNFIRKVTLKEILLKERIIFLT